MTVVVREPRCRCPLLRRGKVREVYEVDADHLLLVASDRVSAFDVVMREAVPAQGRGAHPAERLLVPEARRRRARRHFVTASTAEIIAAAPRAGAAPGPAARPGHPGAADRAGARSSAWCAAISRARPGPSTGSSGTLAGEPLPRGLVESSRLRAAGLLPGHQGGSRARHNVTVAAMAAALGDREATELRRGELRGVPGGPRSRRGARDHHRRHQVRVRLRPERATLRLIDEVMTPDSSRFWPADGYQPGRRQPSFDKQPLRDYLAGLKSAGHVERRGAPAAAPRRGRRGDQPPVPRGLPAHHRAAAARGRLMRIAPEGWPFITGAWVIGPGLRAAAVVGAAGPLAADRALGGGLLPRSGAHGAARARPW